MYIKSAASLQHAYPLRAPCMTSCQTIRVIPVVPELISIAFLQTVSRCKWMIERQEIS